MRGMHGPKIAMVGGGSYNWCPRLLADLMQTPELEGSEVVLLDPKLQAAREVKAAGETMARTLGRRFALRATASETTALRGADFVIITISTGDLPMMRHDLAIPERYGIYATVGDTVGPGGWSRALRNVPVFVHLAQTIERLSPRAVILNYTNPMATLTGAIAASSSLRHVGLCHGVFANYRLLQDLFRAQEKDLAVNFAGVNHFFWILDFAVKGRPGYPALRRKLKGRSIDEALCAALKDEAGFSHKCHTLCDELFRTYGYLPYAGDRHTCEFFPHYLAPRAGVLQSRNLVRTSIADRETIRRRARKRCQKLARGTCAPYTRSRETAVDIMLAIACQKPFCDVVNLPNTGQIENLPRGAVVETLGAVDALGFRPLTVGALPPVLERLVRPHCRVQLMTLEAALKGDRELALQALMMDPQCAHLTPDRVRAMGAELMRATRAYLPQFS